jgi:heptosyltransferase-2
LLVVLPSWVGDAVMATPALQVLRGAMPGAFIGALVRPGIDDLLAGTAMPGGATLVDHWHVERAGGVMGPKHVAARVRPMRYDAALLLTNSFSTALVTRLAFIPRRVGYDRDARGLLLTDRIAAERVGGPSWVPQALRSFKPVPAVAYYLHAARWLVPDAPTAPDPGLRLGSTPEQRARVAELLARARLADRPFALLNPGGNNPLKRWPAERFGALATQLWRMHGLAVAINGSPAESELISTICVLAHERGVPEEAVVALPALGLTLGTLKGVVGAARLIVTNDTGPRHVAAAVGTPCVTLFGPTDHRWTTLPDARLYLPGETPLAAGPAPTTVQRELFLLADPTLPEDLTADDHTERCRIEKIEFRDVAAAADLLLAARAGAGRGVGSATV